MCSILKILTRRKVLDPVSAEESQLARVLGTYDLTALGVGSTLGVGVYVLAGHVARDTAGPAVILSFLIAAITSVFAGLCYAEFGSRVPKAGSAYIYSYVTVGEFVAFIIGWTLILEYIIGSASVTRALSLYLDTLINNTLQDTFKEIAPINVSFMGQYFDIFSFAFCLILAAALAFGMKESSTVNNICTVLNICVVLFVVIAGSFKANLKNWDLPAPTNSSYGTGGFFPYGFSGVIKGAATCFYGFVGFDCIATTGEEVKNPQRAIPISIIASLTIIFLAYFSISTIVTLMVPYYLQDVDAPIPNAFAGVGWDVAKWIIAVGGIFGLFSSLFGSLFPLPRVIYAMASDGIIFKFLGNVSSRFHTPLIGTLLAGLLTGLMSALFDLKQLINMMSIGTLLAYTIVAASVLLLRYSKDEYTDGQHTDGGDRNEVIEYEAPVTFSRFCRQIFNLDKMRNPTKISQTFVFFAVALHALLSLALSLCFMYLNNEIHQARIWAIVLVSVIVLFMILVLISIATQPKSKQHLQFKAPLVPLVPALSISIDIYLMLMLDIHTWIRFAVWMVLGLPMYFICVIKCADSSLISSTSKMHAKFNGTISKTNGHTNPSFTNQEVYHSETARANEELVDNSCLNSNRIIEPKTPSPHALTHVSSPSSPDSASINVAIAALDEVLSREDVLFMSENPFVRKLSIDTVSTASNVHFEESVVAIVHNEDVNPDPILEESAENDTLSNNEILEQPPSISALKDNKAFTSDKDHSPPLPPTPPPMDDFNFFVPKIPRVNLSPGRFHTISKSNLKPTMNRSQSVPEVIYNNNSGTPGSDTSRKSSDSDPTDTNITFGSKQHATIMEKLNKVLQRRSLGLPDVNKLTKPEVPHETEMQPNNPLLILPDINRVLTRNIEHEQDAETESADSDGVVIEETMKPADIKKKLNEILRSDPRLTLKPQKANVTVSAVIEQSPLNHPDTTNDNIDKSSAQLHHKNLMQNTLNSIKLRKVDSFKS